MLTHENSKKKDFFLFLILFILLVLLTPFFISKWLDPDFGWHLRTGQLILERGIPKIDWYSYTMPNYHWIDNETLTDVLIYKIYSIFGFQFLLFIFITLYTASFFIIKKSGQVFWDLVFPIFFGYWVTFGSLGIRPQLLTVLFIAILWRVLSKFLETSSRIIYFLPILFIVWVNLHGGFFAGIFILFAILCLEVFKKTGIIQKIKYLNFLNIEEISYPKILKLGFTLVLSFLATLINPYGLRIYGEIFSVTSDSFLKSHIWEWMPLIYIRSASIWFYIFLFFSVLGIYLIATRKKINVNEFVILLLFFLLSLSSYRYFSIFVIFTIPIFGDLLAYFRQNIASKLGGGRKWAFLLSGASAMVFIFLVLASMFSSNGVNTNWESYPEKATSFLKTLPLSDNLLNEYNWGGYLIWKLPERKVFIDGRMPSWRQGGQFIFGDYTKIMLAQLDAEKLLQKYDIKIVLLSKSEKDKAVRYINYQNKPKSKYQRILKYLVWINPPEKNIYNLLTDLGWHTVYEDNVAIILEK